jgi:hypothetical protein
MGEYTLSGATVNATLISGLSTTLGIAVFGSDLFVTNLSAGTVAEYTTSGATVNAALISGLNDPAGIAISESRSSVVPEASTWAMLLTGFAALAFAGFRRARSGADSAQLAFVAPPAAGTTFAVAAGLQSRCRALA